jgi:hypothetical protein
MTNKTQPGNCRFMTRVQSQTWRNHRVVLLVSVSWTCFTTPDVIIVGEGLQNLGICSALMAFEQEGIFIVPHLLWHGASVFLGGFFRSRLKDCPIHSPYIGLQGLLRTYSYPDPFENIGFRSKGVCFFLLSLFLLAKRKQQKSSKPVCRILSSLLIK